MKKNWIILILVVILAGVAIWVVSTNTKSTLKRELRDFAIADTASVDKIFMVKKTNEQVTLTREDNGWIVNGKYPARPDAVEIILKTLKRIQVKNPVSESSMDNVIKMLATRNTKVEVYTRGKLQKTIYVGGPTQDQLGTFMMLEGSSVPFIVAIPGFAGYLSSRFFTDEKSWRSPVIFDYEFNEISSIKSVNNIFPDQSFIVKKEGQTFEISTLSGNIKAPAIDTLALRYYVSNFEKVSSEFFADDMEPSLKDSLSNATPFRVLEVSDTSGKVKTVEAHERRAVGLTDEEGNPLEWDNVRMYARINGETWVVIQYYVFDPLFRDFDYFFPIAR
jgi:hypothetical protein